MSVLGKRESPEYWQDKMAAYIYESGIDGFKDIIAKADVELIKKAADIASGLTRAKLPAETSDQDVVLKHPLVKDKSITLMTSKDKVKEAFAKAGEYAKKQIGEITAGLPDDAKNFEAFKYIFFALCKNLRKDKVGDMSLEWDMIPADYRMPDHPIWHHMGMTSAIYSCLKASEDKTGDALCLVVYSITPVQDFIGKARKLRDYWTGSVLLSYLSFMGIVEVMEELGPDHILYPSLQNQSLVEQWLNIQNGNFASKLVETEYLQTLNEASKGIASFPNKFVFMCSREQVRDICGAIEKRIKKEWIEVTDIVKKYVGNRTAGKEFEAIWDNTIDGFWKISWASTKLLSVKDEKDIASLLPDNKYRGELEAIKKFGFDRLYGTTHSLVQGILAAGKTKPVSIKKVQKGEKCPLCGEHQVLSNGKDSKDTVEFWEKLRQTENGYGNFSQVGEHERLCAVCTVKRFLPVALRDKKHLLYKTLVETYKEKEFPSTTEMSSWEYLKTIDDSHRREVIESLHKYDFTEDDDEVKSFLKDSQKDASVKYEDFETKYYAFLLMDGDKMGDLINGKTTETSWGDVLNVGSNYKDSPFADSGLRNMQRTINPALHSMISDSLNNFARYGVEPLVETLGEGKLIYAGGDDVCAILPLSKAYAVAEKVRQVYQLSYAGITKEGSRSLVEGDQSDVDPKATIEKFVMHLGHSKDQDETKISLSGAIIIAHHKQPLKEVISDAHEVLDEVAKEKGGRNSLAIRLKKRSGGDRDVYFKWEAPNVFASGNEKYRNIATCRQSFEYIVNMVQGKRNISASLLYHIEELKLSLEPLVKDISKNKNLIVKLFEYEVGHSGIKSDVEIVARALAGICIKVNKIKNKNEYEASREWFNPEAAVIANFMGGGKDR